jgi:hypothetical protein
MSPLSQTFGSLSGWTWTAAKDASPKQAKLHGSAVKRTSSIPIQQKIRANQSLKINFSALARDLAVTPQFVRRVALGMSTSERVLKHIEREYRRIERNSPLPEINSQAIAQQDVNPKDAAPKEEGHLHEATEDETAEIMAGCYKVFLSHCFEAANKKMGPLSPKQDALLVAACKESLATNKPLAETLNQVCQQSGGAE